MGGNMSKIWVKAFLTQRWKSRKQHFWVLCQRLNLLIHSLIMIDLDGTGVRLQKYFVEQLRESWHIIFDATSYVML